jgi:hypothetical protein
MNKITYFICLSLLLLGATACGMHESEQELCESAGDGNLEKVKRLINQGLSVDARSQSKATPLIWAAFSGREAMCRMLVENKASINVKDHYGMTPLRWAAADGFETVCKLLIENKALVDAKDNDGKTPLSIAAFYGRESVCKLLIVNKASVAVKDNNGEAPLFKATRNDGHYAVCKMLIDVQLERGRKKAGIVTFLGITRKRHKHLPCQMQKDVAQMIARYAFETVKRDKQLVIEQIEKSGHAALKSKLLLYVKQQVSSLMK